jgi:DNA-directed RNA polymerase omega subunit
MDRINQTVDSKFRFVLLAAKRAEQLMLGARPKIESPAGVKKVRTAMSEILEKKITWDYGPAPKIDRSEELAVAEREGATDDTGAAADPGVN